MEAERYPLVVSTVRETTEPGFLWRRVFSMSAELANFCDGFTNIVDSKVCDESRRCYAVMESTSDGRRDYDPSVSFSELLERPIKERTEEFLSLLRVRCSQFEVGRFASHCIAPSRRVSLSLRPYFMSQKSLIATDPFGQSGGAR